MCDATDAEANWFFEGGGEVGERIRSIDWTGSPIRHQRYWAPELKTALRLLLASPHPMTLWWGQDRITFYNDAAMPLLGSKHPKALGGTAPDVWHPHWTKLRLDGAESAHATPLVSIQVDRYGELVEYRCTRVGLLDSSDRMTGAVCEFSCDVDVRATITRRQLALLEQFQRGGASARTWSDVGRALTQSIESNPCGIAFAMLYSLEPTRPRLALVGTIGIEAGHPAAPSSMPVDGTEVWAIADAFRTRAPIRMPRFAASGLGALDGLGGARPGTAFAVPLARGEADGLLIVGFDSATVFEPETLQFLSVLAGQVSACVAHAILAHNRSTFQALADSAPMAIFIKDLEGRYVFANPLARSMLMTDALAGLTDNDVLPAETAARLREQDQRVMGGADAEQREETFGDRTFLVIKFPWRDPDGGMFGLYGVALDITQRKQTEDALRRIEKKYRAIGDSINYGVWVCDADGRNIFASDSFLKLTGLSQQECSDSGWGTVLHPDEAEATLRAWQACVEGGGGVWSREHRIKGVDGSYHFILARGVPVRNDAGDVERWVGINLDIGQMKEAEQQLREADRRNDQFLAMLAHELRNPLVPIRNSLHLMHASGLATKGQRDAYDMMNRQVENLVRLVSDMLDLGRIAQRKLALRPTQIDLSGLIDAAIETARPHLDRGRHELVIQFPDEPVSFAGDAERLVQVISNLVINSATYLPPGGRIELRARRVAGDVEVTVTDNGVAALPELQRSAADAIAQYQDGVRFTDGTGIGLALVKDLVEMHGGTVGPGESGTLSVRLPIAGPLVPPTDSFRRVESAA